MKKMLKIALIAAAAAEVSVTGRIIRSEPPNIDKMSRSDERYHSAKRFQWRVLATHRNFAIGRAFPRRLGSLPSVLARMGCAR